MAPSSTAKSPSSPSSQSSPSSSLFSLLLLAHTLLELPASVMFFADPSLTLARPCEAADGVIRQYAALLLSVNLVLWTGLHHRRRLAAVLAPYPADAGRMRAAIALALALYHVPCTMRALARIQAGERAGLGGPKLHALLHAALAAALLASALREGLVLAYLLRSKEEKSREGSARVDESEEEREADGGNVTEEQQRRSARVKHRNGR